MVSILIQIPVYKLLNMEQLCYVIHVHKDTYLQVIIKVVCPNVLRITVVSVMRALTIIVKYVLMDFIQMKLGDV